ncbi:MAG: metal-dependent hydrolase [Gammaproteobacteria bacterium]|nr:metal-dependent hydrolase [Gammaproteobacteria bacterium]
MDSVTQAALGASIAGVCAPKGHRRKALLAGALLGTLPDMDVMIDFGGAVENFTYHRGFSHSLFVLAPFSIVLWLLLKRLWAPAREAPVRWLLAISLALVTHPLLDAHTAYGTQLFWPMSVTPTMWATMFIIDPLYTLPLLVGVVAAVFWPGSSRSNSLLAAGVVLSTVYLAWSWLGQSLARNHADESLAEMGLQDAPVFVVPGPFNTLLWRVVVMTDDGYLEGFDSLLVDEGNMQFSAYTSDYAALREASDVWAVAQLRWFANDFVRADVRNDRLVITDLRMGSEPNYVFRHVAAARGNPHWKAIPTQQAFDLPFDEIELSDIWARIWSGP